MNKSRVIVCAYNSNARKTDSGGFLRHAGQRAKKPGLLVAFKAVRSPV